MKSKELEVKSTKLSKTAKAALPIFALFGGGNGFASSRNPLSLQSSKKLAGKSVVYINETQAPELPELAVNITQQAKSPFAVFTNQAVPQTKSASVNIQSKALKFLKNNDLLSSNITTTSNISGNTASRKTFTDDWQWSTRLSVFPPTATTGSSSSCASGVSYSGNLMTQMIWSYYYSFYCYASGPSLATDVSAANASSILATCQAMHMACDGQPLPVELLKFEID